MVLRIVMWVSTVGEANKGPVDLEIRFFREASKEEIACEIRELRDKQDQQSFSHD
jgi:hypothetical protein